MGPGHYRTEIRRGVKRGSSLTACRFAGYARRSAGVMKWQTCQTQNLVGGNARVGSSPTAGTLCADFLRYAGFATNFSSSDAIVITRLASSSWVMSSLRRSSLIRLFIPQPPDLDDHD